MKMEEYIEKVTEQIRCAKARPMVEEELRDHILDQAEAYEAEGMFEEEALERAVREMGDPVEAGVSLDRVHRPQMEWSILLLVGIISVFAVLIHAVNLQFNTSLQAAGIGYLKNIIMYMLLGYVAMLIVYRLDYSIFAKYSRQIAAGFLLLIFAGTYFFGAQVNGANAYIRLGFSAGSGIYTFGLYVSTSMLMYLYVPMFAALLYHYRGQGYKAVGKLFLWALIPLLFVFKMPAFHAVIIMSFCFVFLFSVAVWKGWYQVAKKRVLAVLWAGMALSPVLAVGGILSVGADYQVARLQAFFSADPDYSYFTNVVRQFLGTSYLIGRNEASVAQIADRLPGINSDFIFVLLVSAYGILAGVLLVVLLLFLVGRIFHMSVRQKNQLGMILGMSCGILFLVEIVQNLAVNLGLVPVMTTTLPFVSSGGSGTIISYMLLGLALSVYRHKNILPASPKRVPESRIPS